MAFNKEKRKELRLLCPLYLVAWGAECGADVPWLWGRGGVLAAHGHAPQGGVAAAHQGGGVGHRRLRHAVVQLVHTRQAPLHGDNDIKGHLVLNFAVRWQDSVLSIKNIRMSKMMKLSSYVIF